MASIHRFMSLMASWSYPFTYSNTDFQRIIVCVYTGMDILVTIQKKNKIPKQVDKCFNCSLSINVDFSSETIHEALLPH